MTSRVLTISVLCLLWSNTSFAVDADYCGELDGFTDQKTEDQFSGLTLRLHAECILMGYLGEIDIHKVTKLLVSAEATGDHQASHMIASIKAFNSADPEVQKEGVEAINREFDAGSKFSAGKLGWAYHLGAGVKKDDRRALELYKIAAEGGMTLWQFLLSHAYEQGYYGLRSDTTKSDYWRKYQPKVQVYSYECAVASLYREGRSFPNNIPIQQKYEAMCEDAANKSSETDAGKFSGASR